MRSVTAAGAGDVRRAVVDLARRAGLDEERVAQFTVAVNEMVINAIRHGGGTADVAMDTDGAGVVVEVRDHGPGFTSNAHSELPSPDQPHGRGLWLARRLCDDLSLTSSSAGTVVRLRATASRS